MSESSGNKIEIHTEGGTVIAGGTFTNVEFVANKYVYGGCGQEPEAGAQCKNSGVIEVEERGTQAGERAGADTGHPAVATSTEKPLQKQTPAPRGRRKSEIFNTHVDTCRLASSINTLYKLYYNPISKHIEVGNDSFKETGFLLSLYFVFVKWGISPSTLVNKQFYAFLTLSCHIKPQESEKTFCAHLNKVVRTGKDFHKLTPEILADEQRQGVMCADELPRWQQMFAAAEALLEQDGYVASLKRRE